MTRLFTAIWLFVAGVLLHNIEEALFLPAWSQAHPGLHPSVTSTQFFVAATAISLELVILAVLATTRQPSRIVCALLAGYAAVMAANALFPHLETTIFQGSYHPGTATGLLFTLPLGVNLIAVLLRRGAIRFRTLAWTFPLVATALILTILLSFSVATPSVRG